MLPGSPRGSSSSTRQATLTTVLPAPPAVCLVQAAPGTPMETNGDKVYDTVNGNCRIDYADVVRLFNHL